MRHPFYESIIIYKLIIHKWEVIIYQVMSSNDSLDTILKIYQKIDWINQETLYDPNINIKKIQINFHHSNKNNSNNKHQYYMFNLILHCIRTILLNQIAQNWYKIKNWNNSWIFCLRWNFHSTSYIILARYKKLTLQSIIIE
jgi:hypothetical protein